MDNLLIMKTKINSKEIGLDVGLLLFKNFLDTDYMHYGLFKDDLDAKIINLPKAQENYSELLLSFLNLKSEFSLKGMSLSKLSKNSTVVAKL